jgi:hypothetical protein
VLILAISYATVGLQSILSRLHDNVQYSHAHLPTILASKAPSHHSPNKAPSSCCRICRKSLLCTPDHSLNSKLQHRMYCSFVAASTELGLGQMAAGYICPRDDADIYMIRVDAPAILEAKLESVPADMKARIDLYGKNFN